MIQTAATVRSSASPAPAPAERRVAQLAAEGLTNREITQALFVCGERGWNGMERRPW
jgi:DNA-binding NarL/FixJ family response regulator